ncbi:MAG: hypothetical protein K2U26_01490 [Cyclobacteriaceae bacterium]|nr:hypothetical protein [Cyclobacteriaceae bacterium]
MKKITVSLAVALVVGLVMSFTSSNKVLLKGDSENLFTCNPPTLTFDGMGNPQTLCANTTYDVRIVGTANASLTSITNGTLFGKNPDDFPTNWRIRPTLPANTTSGIMTIQIWGQCYSSGSLVNSPLATYTYTVLFSGGPGGMCNK